MERILLPRSFKHDLSGQRFGRLVAQYPVEIRKNRHVVYVCKCDCGATRRVTNSNLKSRHTESCGCFAVERISEANGIHYRARTPVYQRWTQMIQRCHLKTSHNYKYYGARGIFVCHRWRFGEDDKTGFECFLADMGEPPAGKWIERENNSFGYSADNCRWATPGEQARNTRRAVRLTHNGITRTVSDWSRALGFKSTDTVAKRIRNGWTVERALSRGASL